MDPLLPTEPSSYRELLQRSLVLYFKSFKKTLGIALLLSIVLYLPRIICDIAGRNIFANLSSFSSYQLWQIVTELIAQVLFIGLNWHMYCTVRHRNERLTEDLRIGLKKLWYVFAATILLSLVVLVAIFLFISLQKMRFGINAANGTAGWFHTSSVFLLLIESLSIIYLATLFIFFVPIIAIENRGILRSLQHSARLVWNHWWRTLSTQVTPWAVFLLISSLVNEYTSEYLGVNLAIYQPIWWLTAIYVILFALFAGWSTALLLVQLKDLELRNHLRSKLP